MNGASSFRVLVWVAVAGLPLAISVACDGKAPAPQGPTTPTSVRSQLVSAPSASARPNPAPSASLVVAPKPPPPCVVTSAAWPEGSLGPKVGSDLAPLGTVRVPAGASLAMTVARTGHVVTFTGPAAFRACTSEDPDLIVIATGAVTVDPAAAARPDAKVAELAIATPGAVAFAAAVPFKMNVGAVTYVSVPKGEVTFGTSDDGEKVVDGELKFPRNEYGAVALSRCVVQTASESAAERLRARIAAHEGPPLPAASVSVLAVEETKHRHVAQVDCGVAQAHMLLCDVAVADRIDKAKEGIDGCFGTWSEVHADIAKARRPVELPPGTPFPPGGQ